MTLPRETIFSRLTARSSVDLPDPDRPIRTEISPSLTVRLAPAQPRTLPVFSKISARVAPLSIMRKRAAVFGAEDDIDILEIDGDVHFLPPTPMRVIRSSTIASTTIARPASSPRSILRGAERAVDLGAEAAGADERCEDHHRQRQHDALGQPRHDGGQRGGQFDLPQQLAPGRAESLAGLDDGLRAPRRRRDG